MKNILFYGNCQMSAINVILNLSPLKYNIKVIECFNTDITKIELVNFIKDCDIIVKHIENISKTARQNI